MSRRGPGHEAWSVVFAGVVVLFITSGGSEVPICTPEHPCPPDVGWVAYLGLLLAACVTAFVHRAVSTVLVVATAVVWQVAEGADRHFMESVAVWALPVVAVAVARSFPELPDGPSTPAGPDVGLPMPTRDRVPLIDRRVVALAAGLALIALAITWWTYDRQADVETQQAAAETIQATVVDRPETGLVRLRLPDGTLENVAVAYEQDYEPGSTVPLLVDTAGLSQPVGEPYDVTGLLVLPLLAGGLAFAFAARAYESNQAVRRFLRSPQTVRSVEVTELPDASRAYLREGDGLLSRVDIPVVGASRPSWLSEPEVVGLRPGLLYGEPVTGLWCAVAVDGTVRIPARPVTVERPVPEPYRPGEPPPRDPDQVIQPDDLADADRYAAVGITHDHRLGRFLTYLEVLLIPVGAVGLVRWLAELGWPVATLIALIGTPFGLEAGWRWQLRPAVRWNEAGVVIRPPGLGDPVRWRWSEVAGFSRDGGHIVVEGPDRIEVILARKRPDWTGRTERTAAQVEAALRDTWQRWRDEPPTGLEPPELGPGRRPRLLIILGILEAAGLTAALIAMYG